MTLTSLDGNLIAANYRCSEVLKNSTDYIIGKNWKNFIDEKSIDEVSRATNLVLENGDPQVFSASWQRADGTSFEMTSRCSILKGFLKNVTILWESQPVIEAESIKSSFIPQNENDIAYMINELRFLAALSNRSNLPNLQFLLEIAIDEANAQILYLIDADSS